MASSMERLVSSRMERCMKSPPTASRADVVTTAIRTPSALPEEIREDLSRRDFYHQCNGVPSGERIASTALAGKRISKTKTIRCVETPSFALRRMRCVSCVQSVFSAVLGFSIQQESSQAARDKAKLLCEISAERICEELCKALCGRWVSQTFALKEVWGQIFPEIDVLGDEIQRLPEDAFLRLIWLYHSQESRGKGRTCAPESAKSRESKGREASGQSTKTPKNRIGFSEDV